MNPWTWLVNEGLYRDLVAVGAAAIVTPVIALRPFKKIVKKQEVIADSLDTSTPGGLTDLLHAIEGGSMGNIGAGPGGDSGAT